MASFFSSAGSFLITVLASVFVFGIVIFIHELGHFLTAKFSGIQVNEFALGMGPTLFSFTRGGTKYGLRLFPIGGFVSMEGEDEESDDPRAFGNAAGWKKVIVLVAGAFMNFLTGLIIVLVLYAPAQVFTRRSILGLWRATAPRTADSRRATVSCR